MKLLINNKGTCTADVLGANPHAVSFKVREIIEKLESDTTVNLPKLYKQILGPNGLNDAEKLCAFHIIHKIIEKSAGILFVAPPEAG